MGRAAEKVFIAGLVCSTRHVDVNRGLSDPAKAADQSPSVSEAEQAALADLFDRWSAWPDRPKSDDRGALMKRIKAIIARFRARRPVQ